MSGPTDNEFGNRKIVKQGWLRKQGLDTKEAWRRRYFVLRADGSFLGYTSVIHSLIPSFTPTNRYTVDKCQITTFNAAPHAFFIRGLRRWKYTERTFYIEPKSERNEWVEAIRGVMANLDAQRSQAADDSKNSLKNMLMSVPMTEAITTNPTTLEDFHILSKLGKGAFGKVILCEKRRSGVICAIKMISKQKALEKMKRFDQVITEYRVLLTTRHPFLISLNECFVTADDNYLCLVTEFAIGGELYSHFTRYQDYDDHGKFNEDHSRFYAAEIVLALMYLHSCNIVYRDLKLENILLAGDGHIKIVDFGCCKENLPYGALTQTFCGTPMYLAPEMVDLCFGGIHCAYSRSVDWWALGVVIYEMVCGDLPFHSHNYEGLYELIQTKDVSYPYSISREAQSLISALLMKNPKRRLGSGESDGEEIMKHPFFEPIDWAKLEQKLVTPPYIPNLTSTTDTRYFANKRSGTPRHGELPDQF